jgi:hypothetical protein
LIREGRHTMLVKILIAVAIVVLGLAGIKSIVEKR